jgi:hypothetical protein
MSGWGSLAGSMQSVRAEFFTSIEGLRNAYHARSTAIGSIRVAPPGGDVAGSAGQARRPGACFSASVRYDEISP